MKRARLAALVLALGPVLGPAAGCSGGDPGPDAGQTITCQHDPRAETYAAGMQKPGQGGTLRFTLVQGDPAPPGRGVNTWTLQVRVPSGAAVEGASLSVTPFMPDHGHGTSVVPVVTALGGGTYRIASLYLFMEGIWTVTIAAKSPGGNDVAVFTFCIPG